ncbi:hypothetical protein BU16DRAFT_555354 [Lophium mytilinum]|uniref:Uncharacterized protein n=1 Tax=Lophium mytilinum TaxID=390894 RepID=A0A6A6RFK1_9PEZI|nr:hypothetical protein BU16DRAFT_555354 [Lophium mytilinum]
MSRSPSVHSIARSINSYRGSGGYDSDRSSDTAGEDEFPMPPTTTATIPPLWQQQERLAQKLGHATLHVAEIQLPPPQVRESIREDESETRSRGSTLADEQDFEFPEKTPTSLKPKALPEDEKEIDLVPEPRVIGPLEQQLSALLSKVVFLERENPTIAVHPDEYRKMQDRIKSLEAEKATWQKRHEALFALRDEDVENNIKIRGLLAKERRDHEAMKKLRDEDLENVLVVRSKLAEATRKLDRLEKTGAAFTPNGRPKSVALERRNTTDLFQAARNAALEQRALELEKANQDLLSQIAALKQGMSATATSGSTDKVTAHAALRDTVSDLQFKLRQKDEELARARVGGGGVTAGTSSIDWHRIEALHEAHSTHREKSAQRLQQLRSEKETLQRELHKYEDENAALEAKVENLQRRLGSVGA